MRTLGFTIVFVVAVLSICDLRAEEKLMFAIDLVRHGDRTPVAEIPTSPYPWKQPLGALTEEGRQQEFQLGQHLRSEYVDQAHLLPQQFKEGIIFVRSTETKRTLNSAQAALEGLYPMETRPIVNGAASDIPVEVVKKEDDDLLLVKPSKNILAIIKVYFMERSRWKEAKEKLKHKLSFWSKATGFDLENDDQFGLLADNLFIRRLHQVPFPAGIDSQGADEIISTADGLTIQKFRMPEVSEPTGRNFVSAVSGYFRQAIQGESELKHVLYSAHDASIMSVLNTLGISFDQVPGFASRLNFALFQDESGYLVKVTFNGKVVLIQRCQGAVCLL
jgi:acid phosphatase